MRPRHQKAKQRKASQKGDGAKKNVVRFTVVFLLFTLLAVAIITKLLYVQVWDSGRLKQKARESRNQSLVLYSRGRILDRNGVVLAQDTMLYDIYAHPKYYWKLTPTQIAGAIAPLLNTDLSKLEAKLSQPYFTISIAKNIQREIVEKIKDARITVPLINHKTKQVELDEAGAPMTKRVKVSGLDFFKKTVRNYPQGTLGAHILGYVNDEAEISSGIERTASDTLKKLPTDLKQHVLDGRGSVVQMENLLPEDIVSIPKAEDVTLTIDSKLQYIAERELANGIERTKAKRGTVIMMNPKNGEVLAFAVYPNYAPQQYFKTPANVLKNWAMTDVYPPGSTFKILTLACGLESGVINEQSKLMDTGKMKVGGWTIQNYDYYQRPHPGMIDLIYLLQHSSNIGSATIALKIPQNQYRDLLSRFGLGQKTAIDLPGESQGILPGGKWDQATHASMGFGYGLAATPLQMAAAIGAIANKGVWVTPHIISNQPNITQRRVISATTSETLTKLLSTSIQRNKTSPANLAGIHVAGKTGTSRRPNDEGTGYSSALYTSFVGYLPAEDPSLLVMVVVDSPGIGEAWGNTVAAPIFKAIADESIGYLGLKPATIASKKPAPKAL